MSDRKKTGGWMVEQADFDERMNRVQDDMLAELFEDGFDRSREDRDGDGCIVRCSQCEALVISGTPTHERGCPNQTFECRGCNAIVARAGSYCEDCA